jgi:cobalt-zinc-cadmium efflux system outer membrane protein
VSVSRWFSSAALTVVVLAVPAFAEQTPAVPGDDPVLAALVEEALANNPDIRGAEEAVQAARNRPAQARSLPNPMLSAGYTNDGWRPTLGTREMTTLAFMGAQDLPYPGKRRLRGEIAEREADQVAQQLERARLSVAARVKRAYYGLVLARDLLELIREQEVVWKQIESVARGRYVVGQGAQQDVLRVQIEVTRIEQLRTEQAAEVNIRVAELNRLLNRPATSPLETSTRLQLRPLEETPEAVIGRIAAISPEVKSASVGVDRARLAVDLARKEYKPDLSVQVGYMNRGGLDPMWQAGIGISIPAYRKRISSAVAEAEAQRRSGERLVESIRLQLRFRVQERLEQLKATERIATLYGEGIVPQDRMSVDAALANYQTGKVPFISVLEALTTIYRDRATHVGLLANHERIRASLEEATLEETSGMTPAGGAGMPVGGTSLTMAGAGSGSAGNSGSGSMSNR